MRLRVRAGVPLAAMVLALGLAAVGLTSPSPALASNGYVETETITYTVNPAGHRLDVSIDIDFRNTSPPTATTGFYYTGVYVWVEHGATRLRSVVQGRSTAVTHVKRSGQYDEYQVGFDRSITYNESRTVHLTYQVPTGAPRSASDVRIGKAIASFCVIGQGDDGGTTRVVVPDAYDVTIVAGAGGDLTRSSGTGASAGTNVWSTGPLAQPFLFWSCLSGTNADGYARSSVTSPGGREIDLEAWPEDPTWKKEVEGELGGILSKLETLVGRELPGVGAITMREVAGSELGNYAGFFNPSTDVIVLGEDLGQSGTVAHELSHAWFNDHLFFSTWMSEGMAEWARVSTVADICPQPGRYPGKGSPDLENWHYAGPRATATDVEVVQFQYEAACYIVSAVASKAGTDHWKAVLDAFFDDQLAYQSPGLVLTRPQIQDTWRQWLDAVDELGLVPAGATDLDYTQNLLAQYGIADDSTALVNRSKARARYHQLVAALGEWTMPEAILRPMSEWGFDIAQQAMQQAEAIRASVAKAEAALPGLDAADGPVRALFQQARTLDDLKAAATSAADQASAAEAVAAAEARIATPRDLLMQIGLVGSDLDGPIAAARAAAKAADLSATQASVRQVNDLLDGASQQGLIRIALAVVVLVLLVLALLIVARRPRRPAPPAPPAPVALQGPPAEPDTADLR